jgi:UDP-N-acetyl-D-galactosamine dehydrogenase
LTFKENCSDDRNSRAKQLIEELRTFGCRVVACDPWLDDERIRSRFQAEPASLQDVEAMLNRGEVKGVVVAAPHKEFQDLPLESSPAVIDIKGALKGDYDCL